MANVPEGFQASKSRKVKPIVNPQEYKLKALTLWRVGVVMKEGKTGETPVWERISQNYAAKLLDIDLKQLRNWAVSEEGIFLSAKNITSSDSGGAWKVD